MSDMRQGLRAWAEVEGERIARDDRGRVATARAGIARRRRRRAAVTLASAVVAIGAVGAIALTLGPGPGLPGSNSPGTSAGAIVLAPGKVPAELQCGKPWVLDRGAVRLATAESAAASGEWSVAFDDGSTTGDTATIEAGFASLGWTARLQHAEGPSRMVLSTVVAVRDGAIVGVAPVTAVGLGDGEAVASMAAPYPGSCGATTVVMPDADYEFHTVVMGSPASAVRIGAPGTLDPALRPSYEAAGTDAGRLRVVVDQVATLTDTSAVAWHARLCH